MSDSKRAISYLTDACRFGWKLNDETGWRFVKAAVAALREKLDREFPKPLTMDELREREGRPIWIEGFGEGSAWAVIDDVNDVYMRCTDEEYYKVAEYGTEWLAYDYQRLGDVK